MLGSVDAVMVKPSEGFVAADLRRADLGEWRTLRFSPEKQRESCRAEVRFSRDPAAYLDNFEDQPLKRDRLVTVRCTAGRNLRSPGPGNLLGLPRMVGVTAMRAFLRSSGVARPVEEASGTVYLVLAPNASPGAQGGGELSDRELEAVVGGRGMSNRSGCYDACNFECQAASLEPQEVAEVRMVEEGTAVARQFPSEVPFRRGRPKR